MLYYIILYHILLYYITLYYIILCYIILYYIILYYYIVYLTNDEQQESQSGSGMIIIYPRIVTMILLLKLSTSCFPLEAINHKPHIYIYI